jgi:hypothetical protein
MNWKPYVDNREIFEHESGFFVIRPANLEKECNTPVFCPLCESIMSSIYDEESFEKYECCEECANKLVYPNIERWKSGWRPSVIDKNKST